MSPAARAAVAVPLSAGQRADAAVAAVLQALLGVIAANLDGAIAGSDDEYLHQLRIAVRRTRTVQRQLAGVFPALELAGFRAELRWLQRTTGPVRDLDVQLHDLDSLRELLPAAVRGDLSPLAPVLAGRRLAARAELTGVLRSARTTNLLTDWGELLRSLPELSPADRPDAQRPIRELAGHRIRRSYSRVIRTGRALGPSSPAAAHHELRKRAKELRYLLALFGVALFDGEAVEPLIKSLKKLQDVLGRHQDRQVQIAMLRTAAAELASTPGCAPACLAIGMLIDRLAADASAARGEVGRHLARLGCAEQRASVRRTFR